LISPVYLLDFSQEKQLKMGTKNSNF
jgi:hypothetical protein